MQLKKIKGVVFTLKQLEGEALWSFQSASIQAINSQGLSTGQDILFGCKVPTQYYRTCLMSPEFFPVINSQIASIVSKPDVPERLRLRAITFLKKIISTDASFTELIFDKIDLNAFL